MKWFLLGWNHITENKLHSFWLHSNSAEDGGRQSARGEGENPPGEWWLFIGRGWRWCRKGKFIASTFYFICYDRGLKFIFSLKSRQTLHRLTEWKTWPPCSIWMNLVWCTPCGSVMAVTWSTHMQGPTWWSLTLLEPPPCILRRYAVHYMVHLEWQRLTRITFSCYWSPNLDFLFLQGDANVQGLQKGGHRPSYLQHCTGCLQEPANHSPGPIHCLARQEWQWKDYQLSAPPPVSSYCCWNHQQDLLW